MSFDQTQLDSWTRQAFSPELTIADKQLRDKFVTEYLIDYNQNDAAIRVGFQKSFAEDYAARFMSEPYVQQQIVERSVAAGVVTDEDRDRRIVLATLRREMQNRGAGGSSAARVNAANSMAKLLGMEPPTKTLSEVTLKSPVQFYIPHNGRDPSLVPVE